MDNFNMDNLGNEELPIFEGSDGLNKNKSVEEQIASVKEELEIIKENISRMEKNLETNAYYKSSAGAADYEILSDSIVTMQDAAEDLQNELHELITNALEKGEIKGDLESILKNPYREENFKIGRVGINGHYAVFSDSERFGKQAIVYENTDRNKCVDYIEQRQPAMKPTYYVIENLHDFAQGINQNIVYGTFEECLQLYQQYSALEECQEKYNKMCGIQEDISATKTTVVLGVKTGKNDQDIILNMKGHPFFQDLQGHPVFNEAVLKSEHGTNKYILDDLSVIRTQIEDTQGKEISIFRAQTEDICAKADYKDDYLFVEYSGAVQAVQCRKETVSMISILENAEKEYLDLKDKYLNSDLDIQYADVQTEEKKVEELKDICAEKLVKAVEKDIFRLGELTQAGARKLLEPEFREQLKTALIQNKDIVSLNAAYINHIFVPCTGYQNRPEITQKFFDKMIYQRDKTILKYEILDEKKEREILKDIVKNGDKEKAFMYIEAKAEEESTIAAYHQRGTFEIEMEKHLDFENCYFSGIKLEGTFEGVDFSDCYFYNCKIENAEFKDCNFKNATLSNMEGKNVSFQNTDFEKADLWFARFENTQFKDVNFSEGNWRSISTVRDTVSFENCDFTMTNMNSVYIQGSKIIGEMKNINTISVTMGGATGQEIKKHERMIKETLGSGNARGKQIGKKENLGNKRASGATASRKSETRRQRGKSR